MEPKGNALLKKEFTATKLWPDKQFTLNGVVDLEAEYKKALAGRLVIVMDIAVDGEAYLVLGKSETVGEFLWQIEKDDVVKFIPVIKKGGTVMPAGLSPIEQFAWMANNLSK